MKRAILLSVLCLSFFSIRAQDNLPEKQNEVKINGLFMVRGAFEGTYERLLNKESGVGVSLFLPIDDDAKDVINYYISPYYRMYFGEKYASGFYMEGFGMLSSVRETVGIIVPSGSVKDDVTDFALGIGIGGKWVANNGFIGGIGLGLGRNLFNTDITGDDFVVKAGINLGYRF